MFLDGLLEAIPALPRLCPLIAQTNLSDSFLQLPF